MNNSEANVLRRQLNHPDYVWPVGEVKTYSDMHEVFQFMRYGFPAPAETHNAYLDVNTIPAEILVASGWIDSLAGYLSAHLYEAQGSKYVALTPMHGHPLTIIRLGCSHNVVKNVMVGRYAYDSTCQECGHKWTTDSGD